MDNRKVRVRFAPSPTGPLHIGGVRTALYNYLFARQHGGELIFRIEDTDSQRFVKAAEDYIIESFKWLGIQFDEGVSYGGDKGPYRQSERREIYKQYVDQLLAEGKAYIAFDTPEELQAKRAEIENFQYDAHTRGMMRNSLVMPADEVQAGQVIASVGNSDSMWIEAYLEPEQQDSVRLGQVADYYVDRKKYEGLVMEINQPVEDEQQEAAGNTEGSYGEAASGKLVVRISISPEDASGMKIGENAEVRFLKKG